MKILLLGIGNVLFGDEGVGVHLATLMITNYRYDGPHQVDILDGGTLAHHLIPTIAAYDHVVILDTVDVANSAVGEVYFFDYAVIPDAIRWQGSAHEVEMLHTLTMMDMAGDRPTTFILGVVPEVIAETSFVMTPAVLHGAAVMEKKLLAHLHGLGVQTTRIAEKTLTELAQKSCQPSLETSR
ncbi:HyaD/HybD family hydrogenase maturation endopeptidase [Chrysiogenes arsenatis]|uniref:HyaD/HybD family hydrogenase maturation endopeptidase n=1 Tax=Chrysiogenes arsenatis TaxID=309797 RepID=UPI0004212FB5|nr:HyaD/HybD family hydrogenase maturation endopeptidase [Chrysiogenes arsenatis]